jgi:diguanylate cyclase (GGDEF)-like protein/PAS domain S-box-containing protein
MFKPPTPHWKAESFMDAVIHRAAEGICICQACMEHPFVRFTLWNRRMTEITGYNMEEINRLGWYQTLYPDEAVRAAAVERMAGMREGDDITGEEWEITAKDGQTKTLLISTSVIRTMDGAAHVLGMMHDITERKKLENQLREQAAMDCLTRLYNRRHIIEALEKEIARLNRYGGCLAVMMLDLDHFKRVNDDHGHLAGDATLREVARIAKDSLRPYDVIGRFGGEEFFVLLPETCREDARIVGERIRERIAGARFVFDGSRARVTVSIGVAQYRASDDCDSIIKRADDKLYVAKRTGRDQVVL